MQLVNVLPVWEGAADPGQRSPARREGAVMRTGLKSNRAGTSVPLNLLAIGNLDRGWLVALAWTRGTTRANGESKMMARFGKVLYWCGLATAFICWIAALTILAAIVTDKLSDSGAWMAVVFFAVFGGIAWVAGHAARSFLADLAED
jgi:hypothetical protein